MAAPPRMGAPPVVPPAPAELDLEPEPEPEQLIRRAPPIVPIPKKRMEPEPEPEPIEELVYDIGEPDTYEVSYINIL